MAKNIAIKSIRKITETFDKYDIEVENDNNFFANGILVHNCRMLTILDTETRSVKQFSRNGKEAFNFTEITTELENLLPYLTESIVLDGEVISASFQQLMTQFNRKEKVDTSNAKLALFDIIPLKDFKHGICYTKQIDRHNQLCQLQELFQTYTKGRVYVIPKLTINLSTEEGKQEFKFFNNEAITAGYEGILIKNPDGPYTCDRTSDWMKLKPFISCDLAIIGMDEGTGKYQGKMGNIICEGVDNGLSIRVQVGSGFSDEQREEFWNNKEKFIGMIAEVKADAVSQNQDGNYSLRFPRFERFRGNEPGEKI